MLTQRSFSDLSCCKDTHFEIIDSMLTQTDTLKPVIDAAISADIGFSPEYGQFLGDPIEEAVNGNTEAVSYPPGAASEEAYCEWNATDTLLKTRSSLQQVKKNLERSKREISKRISANKSCWR